MLRTGRVFFLNRGLFFFNCNDCVGFFQLGRFFFSTAGFFPTPQKVFFDPGRFFFNPRKIDYNPGKFFSTN